MALQGTLDTFALPDVLRLLAATKKTGRLRLTGSRGTGSVWVSSGDVAAVEATHAPHATGDVDTLFELLRFEDGAFTFDAEATHDAPGQATDAELLIGQSEALLAEWRDIEAVVPSMDAWVTLRQSLPRSEVTVDQERWTTIVAVGAGATVRRIGDDLCLPELPISRAIKELTEAGLLDITEAAPSTPLLVASRAPTRPLIAPEPEPEVFVPIDLPVGRGAFVQGDEPTGAPDAEVADFAVAFPGLANRTTVTSTSEEEEELARQLATLSPRAARAVRAAGEAGTDEEREAALDAADSEDQPLNRGLLLKFLSSVKS